MSANVPSDKHSLPTPRTDAEACDGWSGDAECVGANFARQLERELAHWRQRALGAEDSLNTANCALERQAGLLADKDRALSLPSSTKATQRLGNWKPPFAYEFIPGSIATRSGGHYRIHDARDSAMCFCYSEFDAQDVVYGLNAAMSAPSFIKSPTAKEQFDEHMKGENMSALERLRFFCSLAMNGQDWLDAESFFDDLSPPSAIKPIDPAVIDLAEGIRDGDDNPTAARIVALALLDFTRVPERKDIK